MGNSKQATPNATWTSTQAYVLAVICLVVGVGAGWIVRGSDAPAANAAVTQTETQGAVGGAMTTPAGQQPTPEQMKRMADAQAEPMLAQLKSNPRDASLLAQIGNVYYDTQSYQQAVDYYRQALDIEPGNANVRTDMGTAYFYMGDSDRAIKEFETALKYDPKHAQTMFNLGMVKWQGKMDSTGAVAAWENLLKTAPEYPDRDKVEKLIAQAKQHSSIKPGTKTEKPAGPVGM